MIPSLSLSVKNQIVGAKIAKHDKTAFAGLSTSTVVDSQGRYNSHPRFEFSRKVRVTVSNCL